MIGKSINLNVTGSNATKEPKQNRKTRVRSSMPEGGETTFDFFFGVCFIFNFFFILLLGLTVSMENR